MKILIERLSAIYGPWSQAQQRNRKLEKESQKVPDATVDAEIAANSAIVDSSFNQVDDKIMSIEYEKNQLCENIGSEIEASRLLGTKCPNTSTTDRRKNGEAPIKPASTSTCISTSNTLCNDESMEYS